MRRHLAALLVGGAALLPAAPALAADPAALCAGRPGCAVHAVTPAGTGETGQALRVVEVRLEEPPAGSDYEGQDCYEGWREFSLVEGDSVTPLLQLCNDGYGASGVGEDMIEIGENRLLHGQYGGSSWRWAQTLTYQLSPLKVLTEGWDGFWTVGLVYESGSWDWTDWSHGTLEWWSPRCAADGTLPLLGDDEPRDEDITRAVLIPLLDSLPAGAEQAGLGTCATVLSAETGNGYVIHGDAAAAIEDHAWMKLMAAEPDLLFVSVRTGRVASGGKSWLADDHIEIWQGPKLGYSSDCIPFDAQARQWAVRLVDGAVFAAAGDPQDLPEVLDRSSTLDSDGGVIVHMTIRLADPRENLTVLFSKGDGKKRQLWMLASSALQFKQAATLGDVFAITADQASCVINEGRLDVVEWGRPVAPAQ